MTTLYFLGVINLIVIVWILHGYYKECKLEKLREYDRICTLEAEKKEREER